MRTTDMADELFSGAAQPMPAGVRLATARHGGVTVTRVEIAREGLSRPRGRYVTLEMPSVSVLDERDAAVIEVCARELRALLPQEGPVLVLGVGNRRITADALGPRTVQRILVTMGAGAAPPVRGLRPVAAVAPGVAAATGLSLQQLAAALVGLVDPIVRLISTPEEAVAGTTAYLTICFIGIPCITAYNVLASIFRGMGDSRSPMYFIAAACVVNIGLDFFFMGALRLGPAGAALGTTLSQAVSVLLALCVILKRRSIRLSKSDFCPRKATMKDILSIGLPVAAQDGFIQVSFMLITIMANQRGLTDAAAVGIVEKIISFLFLVPSSMLSTGSALGAQNIGAGKYDRTDDILRYAVAIGVGFGAVMALLMQFIAPGVVRPFTSDEAVVLAGVAYIRSYIFDCLFAGIQFSFSGYFCAWGRSGLSFLHNTLSILLVRVPGAWLACRFFPQTLVPMGLAPACGSLFSSVVCVLLYRHLKRQDKAAKRRD